MGLVRDLAAVGIVVLSLAGCQSDAKQPATSVLPGTPAAGIVGSLIGNTIGRDLTETDRSVARDAEYQALEFGRAGAPVSWRSPSGRYGEVIPETTYSVNETRCREYTQAVYLDGRPEIARGTACRQPDGTWRSVA